MAPTSTSDTRRLAVVSINYMFMRFCDADTNQSQSLDADKFYAMQSPAPICLLLVEVGDPPVWRRAAIPP